MTTQNTPNPDFIHACEGHTLLMDGKSPVHEAEIFPPQSPAGFWQWQLVEKNTKTIIIDHDGSISYYFFEDETLSVAMVGSYLDLATDNMTEIYSA